MQPTPRSLRLHIGIFGRRNVGKSSLLNAITRQHVSIVSAVAGTTTDPVEKPMELLPLGPVQFVDTAGVDDEGALGDLRIERTKAVLDRVDLGVVVTEGGAWGAFEDALVSELESRARASARGLQQVRPADAGHEGARAPSTGAHPVRDRVVADRRGRGGCARGTAVAGAGRLLRQPAARHRPRAARRSGRAGRSDRQGSAEGPADPPAGDGHPRSARRGIDGARCSGTRTEARARPADPGAGRSSSPTRKRS